MVSLPIPTGRLGKHESAHPLDLVGATMQREMMRFRALLEQFAGLILVAVGNQRECEAGLRGGDVVVPADGFFEGRGEFAGGGDGVGVYGVGVDVDLFDGGGLGQVAFGA